MNSDSPTLSDFIVYLQNDVAEREHPDIDEPVLYQYLARHHVEGNLGIAISPTEWAVFVQQCHGEFADRVSELAGELFTDFKPEKD